MLAADHLSVVFPDVDTPFTDTEDVVRRLLPYHVLQQPAKDLQEVIFDPYGKGKARAVHNNEVENKVDIEGGYFVDPGTSSTTDRRHRCQVDDRILQKGPFASPTVSTSENEVFAGAEHQFLARSQLLNPYSAHLLKTKHMCSRILFWIQNETK